MRCSFGRLMIGIPSVDESDSIATHRPALWTHIWTQLFGSFWTPPRMLEIAIYGGTLGSYLDTLLWDPSALLLGYLR